MPLRVDLRAPADPVFLGALLEGVVAANYVVMEAARRLIGPHVFPPLYESGIRYAREAPGRESWQFAHELLETREGDCEDLACYRAAELRLDGEPAIAEVVRTPRRSFHAVVRRADGRIEDPSKILLGWEPP
jgi:hypothetical protein